jgi:hypothetical protein
MMRPFMRSARVHDRDEALDVFKAAAKVTVLTLWTPPETLSQRLAGARKWYQFPTKREKRIAADYSSPRRVLGHYDRWLGYLESKGYETMIIEQDGETRRFLSAAEWRSKVEPLRSLGAAEGHDED